MKNILINENIEEVIIRLVVVEWYLDTLKTKDIGSVQCLLNFFKNEVKESLKSLEKFYFGMPVKKSKTTKNVKIITKRIKNAKPYSKRKTKKSTKNKKSKKKD